MKVQDPIDSLIQEAARREMVKGVLWLVVGALISFGTYAAASSSDDGGTYVLLWGAIVYGGYRFLRGLYYWFNPAALQAKIDRG